jgi:hypothetical protein
MVSKCAYFLKVLRAELEDLLEDLKAVEAQYRQRFDSLEITNYVLLENEALLIREEDAYGSGVSIDGMNSAMYKM